jgi:hypothetical protein
MSSNYWMRFLNLSGAFGRRWKPVQGAKLYKDEQGVARICIPIAYRELMSQLYSERRP